MVTLLSQTEAILLTHEVGEFIIFWGSVLGIAISFLNLMYSFRLKRALAYEKETDIVAKEIQKWDTVSNFLKLFVGVPTLIIGYRLRNSPEATSFQVDSVAYGLFVLCMIIIVGLPLVKFIGNVIINKKLRIQNEKEAHSA